jgi:hypothetical protein
MPTTLRQFNRQCPIKQLETLHQQVVDTTVLYYHHLLLQGFFDLKQANTPEGTQYPLALIFISCNSLIKYFDLRFPHKQFNEPINCSYYMNLWCIEKELTELQQTLNEWLLCLTKYRPVRVRERLAVILKHAKSLVNLTGNDLSIILDIAIKLYKKIGRGIVTDKQAVGGLASARKKYVVTTVENKTQIMPKFIEEYLQETSGNQTKPVISRKDIPIFISRLSKQSRKKERSLRKQKTERGATR